MEFKKSRIALGFVLGLGMVSNFVNATSDKLPLNEISKIAEVFSIIDQRYVENKDKSELMLNALSGMVSSLDPYSQYLSNDNAKEFSKNISGENVGIGVIIVEDEKGIKIETVLKNSPAEKSGLESGDIIIKVGEYYIIDKFESPLEAISDISGEAGTEVSLTIQKPDKTVYELVIERNKFVVPSTSLDLLNKDFGYLYISSFQENTHNEIKEEFKTFNKNNPDSKGFIIDLRSNPGGLLKSAIDISDLFLNEGKIVSTKGRGEDSIEESFATEGDIANGKPIVILINGGTASAAEILSGAIQDNKRGLIVGQTSFGKGSVQSIFPLSGHDGDMIKITVARYYTPSGKSIQAEGISPDIRIERVSNIEIIEEEYLREKDKNNHISNDTNYKSKDKSNLDVNIKNDYQLYEALNVLKAATLLKENKNER